MARRLFTFGALAGGGALGYYFYQAGGNTEKTKQLIRSDVSSISQKTKEEDKSAQNLGAKLDTQIDRAKEQGKSLGNTISAYGDDAAKRLDDKSKSTGNELMKGVDKFDKAVEDSAAQAKGGISSWFGLGK